MSVAVTDAAGNVGSDATTDELEIETIAPAVTYDPLVTDDWTPQLTGTVDDPSAGVVVTIESGGPVDAVNNGDGTWTLGDFGLIPEGVYDITVEATDAAGNVTTITEVDGLEILLAITVDELFTSDTTPELSGTLTSLIADVSVNVLGVDYAAVNNGDGTWTLADDTLAALAEGTYQVIATTDNPVTVTVVTDDTTDELTVDTTAPATVTVDPLTTTIRSPELTGTVSDTTAVVSLFVNGVPYNATNNADGTWTLASDSLFFLGTRTYDVTATARDAAGNSTDDPTAGELSIRAETTITMQNFTALRVAYRDPDGSLVRIRMKNRREQGFVVLSFGSNSAISIAGPHPKYKTIVSDAGVWLSSIQLGGELVKLTMSVSGGNRVAEIGNMFGSGKLNVFSAPKMDLIGGINTTSVIDSINLGSIQGDVTMQGTSRRGVKIRVARQIENANISLPDTSIAMLMCGSLINSTVYSGVLGVTDDLPAPDGDGVIDLPGLVGGAIPALRAGYSIKRLIIRGYKNAVGDLFVNSNIAADSIGTIQIRDADLSNDGTAFGVAANEIRRLTLRDVRNRVTYKWNRTTETWSNALAADDLTINLPVV